MFKNYEKTLRKEKKAFTLSEVLVTLTIIGIIAALTVPMVMGNHKKVEYATKLKKGYSLLSSAIKLTEQNINLPINKWTPSMGSNASFYNSYLKDTLKGSKSADFATSKAFESTNSNSGMSSSGPNASTSGSGSTGSSGSSSTSPAINTNNAASEVVRLDDGTYMIIAASDNAFIFTFDLNGLKGPNEAGRDRFSFVARRGSGNSGDLIPRGCSEDGTTCTRQQIVDACRSDHEKCTELVVLDGWEFNTGSAKDNNGSQVAPYPLKI